MKCTLCDSNAYFFHKKDNGKEYFICSNCGLIFLNPRYRLDYNKEKTRYDKHNNSPEDKDYVKFLQRLSTPLLERIKPNSDGLDFGSGPGPTMCTLLPNINVSNYDPIYNNDKVLLESKYDFVTCTEVVEHFFEPREEFLLLKALLKRKSHLGIMTQILEKEDGFSSWWYHKDPTHVSFYQKKTFDWIGEWLGWKIEILNDRVIICTVY
jgi:hypothetical protein